MNLFTSSSESSALSNKIFRHRKWLGHKTLLTALFLLAFCMQVNNAYSQSVRHPQFTNTGNLQRDSANYKSALNDYRVWKLTQKKQSVTPGVLRSASASAVTNADGINATNCLIPRDASWIAVPTNDDGFIGPINLGFNFDLYGTSYNRVWINTNGNLTFTAGLDEFNASGFPFNIPMVAAFWADEDTRACGRIYYKIDGTHLIVSWEGVGYYDQKCDLLNTFQIVIGTVTDPFIGSGNNVLFNYGSMNWTTGEASDGGPFGGIPATVGVNKGNGTNYIQVGRFNVNNSSYDGPGGATDGVHYLDNKCFSFNVSSGTTNVPPSFSGLPAGNTITVQSGSTTNLAVQVIGPEVNQSITSTVNTNGLCNVTSNITNGAVSTVNLSITGAQCNLGSHTITINSVDNGTPAQSNAVTLTIIVTPEVSNPCNLSASVKIDSIENSLNKRVTITPTGGTAPYTYALSGRPGNSTGIFNDVVAGTYNYSVTDAAGCSTSGSFTITSVVTPPVTPGTIACPPSISIIADPLTCKATASWTIPTLLFPDTISEGSGGNKLIYKGTFNGHGYYESTMPYTWMNAKSAAESLGGHLITITSAEENGFVLSKLKQTDRFTWIGLSSTGTPGAFKWVTGEPFAYSNWIPGQPDNLYGSNSGSTVYEPYIQIDAYVDSTNRWNDAGDMSSIFLVEFDQAVINYRQYAGVAMGESLTPGTYTICYQATNGATQQVDTCCFSITVTCNTTSQGCPRDTTIVADPLTCKAKVSWTVPSTMYPGTIDVAKGGGAAMGSLMYKGTFNGHGYYQSSDLYTWPDAKNAISSTGGHLITINSAAENSFLLNNFDQTGHYAWIGLYNTGTPGSFAWVTGEPVTYTNWIAGQPDNLYSNSDPNVYEPYVQINGYFDNLNRWNDIGTISSIFLAEFDSPVISYRQISGPNNGDSLMPGVYRVCYEISNSASQTKDTCCFNITVTCSSTAVANNTIGAQNASVTDISGNSLKAIAYPNPTNTSFKVRISTTNNADKITMKVVDITGRMIETRSSVLSATPVTFGARYAPGVYFTTITQGSKTVVLKLVKQ